MLTSLQLSNTTILCCNRMQWVRCNDCFTGLQTQVLLHTLVCARCSPKLTLAGTSMGFGTKRGWGHSCWLACECLPKGLVTLEQSFSKLPYLLSACQSAQALWHMLQVVLVVFVWLSVVPLSTCWLWRLGFTRSLSEVSCLLCAYVWVFLFSFVHPT